MGYAARQNDTARQAATGKLMSRQTMMGAMDHALERHADALRLLEARIRAQDERIAKLETTCAAEWAKLDERISQNTGACVVNDQHIKEVYGELHANTHR